MPHLHLKRKRKLSAFRRMAIGTWRAAYDPQAFGRIMVPMAATRRYIDAYREATGKHLTITHLMAKVAAAILVEFPDANALLRFNRVYLREEVSVFFQVALRDPQTGQIDLSGVKIDAPHEKSLAAIIDEFEAHARAVREGTDPELEATRRAFQRVPSMLLGATFRVLDFLMYRLNLDLRWAGLPRDPYGAIMVTNVGSLGVEEAFAPIVPQSHVSVVVAVGEIHEAPLVKDGEVVVGEVMPLSATFDHRLLDGVHAANMVGLVKRWFADPFAHFDPIPGA